MIVEVFEKFEDIKQLIPENGMYTSTNKSNLEWAVHNFYRKEKNIKEKYYVYFDDEKNYLGFICIIEERGEFYPMTIDFPHFVPTIAADYFIEALTHIEECVDFDDISPVYKNENIISHSYNTRAYQIDLHNVKNIDDYFESLDRKKRKNLKLALKKASGLTAEIVENFKVNDYTNLINNYKKYWAEDKNKNIDTKIDLDLFLCNESASQEKTLTILLKNEKNEVIGFNQALYLDYYLADVICVYDPSYKDKEIGKFAVVENIKYAIEKNIKIYDFSTTLQEDSAYWYKKQFINENELKASFLRLTKVYPPAFNIATKSWLK